MKYKKKIILELERYPEKCEECPAFHTSNYICHNERGIEGDCEFGYMDNCDMRDFYGQCLFSECDIRNDPDVRIMEDHNG